MITNFYKNVNESFSVAHFALQNTKFGSEKGRVQKPARRRGLGRNAGGKRAEAGRIHSPRQIVSPRRVSFNHLDFARNSFELCPKNTANNKNNARLGCYFVFWRKGRDSNPRYLAVHRLSRSAS